MRGLQLLTELQKEDIESQNEQLAKLQKMVNNLFKLSDVLNKLFMFLFN